MRDSKQPKSSNTDKLAQPVSQSDIELSESALAQASGGALNAYLKLDALKCDGSVRPNPATPGLLLPAVQPKG